MKKTIFSVAILALTLQPALADDLYDMTTVDVSASAEVSAAPDIATLSAGVTTQSPTAAAAMQENAKRMNAVFAAVKQAGIAEKDMQTSGLSLHPQYDYRNNQTPRITGYQASNMLNIKVRDLKSIGPVLDTLVAQGANQINGPTFAASDADSLLDSARADAVKKAAARAELYARAAGMRVKRLVRISENTQQAGPPMPMMRAMAMESSAPTPVAPGAVDLSVNVNVMYELSP